MRFQTDRHMLASPGGPQRKGRIFFQPQFIANLRNDSGRKITIGGTNDLERERTWKLMSGFQKFDRRKLHRGNLFSDDQFDEGSVTAEPDSYTGRVLLFGGRVFYAGILHNSLQAACLKLTICHVCRCGIHIDCGRLTSNF